MKMMFKIDVNNPNDWYKLIASPIGPIRTLAIIDINIHAMHWNNIIYNQAFNNEL